MLRLDDATRHLKIESWFEGFEAELREICKEEKVGNEISYHEYKMIKEILGE